MERQETDWGEILWMDGETGVMPVHSLQVGLVSIPPGGHQAKHLHYEEQVIYVTEGCALSVIDGAESRLGPGDLFHWKAGVEHEIWNTGGGAFRHLLVSNPMSADLEQVFPDEGDEEVSPDLIYTAVEAIRTQFLDALHYGHTIYDAAGGLIIQSRYFPEYCIENCFSDGGAERPCMRQLKPEEWRQEREFYCRYGMEVFHYPIYFKGTFLGYIQSGHIRHSGMHRGNIEQVYDVPESVVTGIRALILRIVKAIRNYCEFEQFRRDLMEKELCIASHEEARRMLMQDLQETQYAVTDLKIDRHFLFNTLNSMASMALDGGMEKLYQSIVDLSKMFRYTVRTQDPIVPLEKELDYVRAYLQLQKLRYENALEVSFQVSQEALGTRVPFNFLQPVVENAFIHGFDESVRKQLKIRAGVDAGYVRIEVENSGRELTPQMCRAINQGITGSTSHGLAMIRRKLAAVFGEDCVLKIGREENGHTCFRMILPYMSGQPEGREP